MQKLSLEVGKVYETREGDQVELVKHVPGDAFPFIGIILELGTDGEGRYSFGTIESYAPDGSIYSDGTSERDLVREYQPPRPRFEGWIVKDSRGEVIDVVEGASQAEMINLYGPTDPPRTIIKVLEVCRAE